MKTTKAVCIAYALGLQVTAASVAALIQFLDPGQLWAPQEIVKTLQQRWRIGATFLGVIIWRTNEISISKTCFSKKANIPNQTVIAPRKTE